MGFQLPEAGDLAKEAISNGDKQYNDQQEPEKVCNPEPPDVLPYFTSRKCTLRSHRITNNQLLLFINSDPDVPDPIQFSNTHSLLQLKPVSA